MITVNPIYIHEVLAPLIGGADIEEDIETYGHCNADREAEVKKLAIQILLPAFDKQHAVLKQITKDTLAYYLVHPNKIDFESIFNSLLLPLETPRNAALFFQWLWDVFFDGESTDYIKSEIIREDFDVNAPLFLLTGKGGRDSSPK